MRKINRYRYNQFKLKKEKKINDQAELILFLFKIRGAGGMEGIKEKKKKGRSIGSDRREEENNYFKKNDRYSRSLRKEQI